MISFDEVGRILAKIQAFDRRNVGRAEVVVWTEALQSADPPIAEADALAAVTRWFAVTAEGWIRPAHVISGAQEVAKLRRRLEREHAHQQAIEAAPIEAVGEHSDEVLALLRQIRDQLGPGRPDALRRPEWVRAERHRQRAQQRALAIGGTGFCVPCYRHGRVVLASDPVAGSTCEACEGRADEGQHQ